MTMSEIASKWQVVLGLILFIVGATLTIDSRFDKAGAAAAVQFDFDTYKVEMERNQIKRSIWETQDRLETKKSPEVKKELQMQIRELKDSLDKADERLLDLKKGKNNVYTNPDKAY
jgi:hypothetical protein